MLAWGLLQVAKRQRKEFPDVDPFARERCRVVIDELKDKGQSVSVAAVRGIAGVAAEDAQAVVRAFKAGKTPPLYEKWDNSTAYSLEQAVELAQLIREAKTDAQREAVALEISARAVSGELDDKQANAARQALAEARHQAKAHREAAPEEESEQLVWLSRPAARLARVFDVLVSRAKREELQAHAERLLREDLEEHPNTESAA